MSSLSERAPSRAPFLAALMASVVLAGVAPTGHAETVTEARTIGAFRTVRLVGSADLVISQSDTPSLKVEADKEVTGAMTAEIRGDELVLTYDPKKSFVWWNKKDKDSRGPRFVLAAKTLERLSTSGSGDVRADAWTSAGDFEIAVSGSSDIKIGTLAARKLLVRITGNGDIALGGGVLEQNVKIAGSGDYKAGGLQSAQATLAISGSGDAVVSVRDSLTVNIAGSGDVKYYGRPAVTRSIAGSGSITGLGDRP